MATPSPAGHSRRRVWPLPGAPAAYRRVAHTFRRPLSECMRPWEWARRHAKERHVCATRRPPGATEQQQEQRKMKEQSGNVYENKGPLWKTRAESGML
jgi:hypothetical protein